MSHPDSPSRDRFRVLRALRTDKRLQPLRFVASGAIQFAVDIAVFLLSVAVMLPAAAANVLGRLAGMLAGHVLHRHFTFNTSKPRYTGRTQFWRYLAWWIATTATTSAAIGALEAGGSTTGLLVASKVAIEVLLVCVSFFVYRYWVYAAALPATRQR